MQKHQPERFKEYYETEDKTGFKIHGCDTVFKYEEDGGWKDEHGNYYDCNGLPVYEESDEEDDYNSYDGKSWSDYEDDYDKLYGPNSKVIEDFQNEPVDQSAQILEKIGKNLAVLQNHPAAQPLRVEFEILDIPGQQKQPSEKELLTCYSKKVNGIINVFYEDDDEDEDAVIGYFVVKDVDAAQHLINLEGENIVGYDMTFSIQPFEELKVDPLSKDQLKDPRQKFVQLGEAQKLYIVSIQGGFKCKAKDFNDWLRGIGLEKHGYEVIKMKKSQEGKVPIMKIKNENIEKIKSAKFEGLEVSVVPYKPKEDPEEKKQEEGGEGGEKKEE